MRAGPLQDRIVVERLVDEPQDTAGQVKSGFMKWFDAWAEFTPLSATERYAAERVMAAETGTFRVRARSDFEPSAKENRIKFQGRVWNITGVQRLMRNDGWLLSAEIAEIDGAEQQLADQGE